MTIREAVERISSEDAIELATAYYAASEKHPGTLAYTGAHFETFSAEQNLESSVTADDLLAVQMLAVTVSGRAALGILGDSAGEISELLSEIEPELCLEGIEDEEQFDEVLGKDSPALKLWDLLRRNDAPAQRWRVGPTTASKIMARKRPRLIPIEDSVVNRVIQLSNQNSWRLWWEALRADGYLKERADEVKVAVGRTDLSTLRALDIVLWMWGTKNGKS